MHSTSFPLHPAQQDVFTDQLINTDSPQYNVGGYIVLKGHLDEQKFQEVIQSAPGVLDFFKLRFDLEEPDFLCHYDEGFDRVELDRLDFSNKVNPRELAREWAQQRFNTAFKLNKESLPFEQCLIKIAEDEHWFFGKYHHLITDGYGFIVWTQYFARKYNSLVAGDNLQFNFPRYKDEAVKANQYLSTADYEADGNYWKNKIPEKPGKLLQKRYSPQTGASVRASSLHKLHLDDDQRKLFEEIQLNTKVGLQQLTIAALLIYFGQTTAFSEFIFGVPIHKRGSRVLRNIVGMFSGILPFKGGYDENTLLADLLKEIAATQRGDYRHQNYLIGDLSRHLKINTAEGYLCEVIVNYEPLDFELDFGEALQASIVRIANEDERNPLQLSWRDYGSQQPLELQVHFNHEYFRKEEIDLLTKRIIFIIGQFPASLDKKISNIEILPPEEKLSLSSFSAGSTIYTAPESITALFEEQAEMTPDENAIVFEAEKITYKELNDRANQLALCLREKGVEDEMPVPLFVERSIDMLVGILGILKAGGAYVPIDPEYPLDRIRFILNDTSAGIVVSSKSNWPVLSALGGLTLVAPDDKTITVAPSEQPARSQKPDQLAYIIYTSGSTGRPKGVLVEHKNVVSLVKGVDYVQPGVTDRLLVTGSPSFDATSFEYWSMLLNGGCLILCKEEQLLDSEQLKNEIRRNDVTMMWFTSSWFNQLTDSDISIFEGLTTILVGGEKLSEQHIEKFRRSYPETRLINGYGPTENTTFSLTYEIGDIAALQMIPIGRPLSNRQAFVLDSDLKMLPVGVEGEIYLGGAGLSRGYLNLPGLTSEKFIPNPFSGNASTKLYRTGDLGRWLTNGNLEYLGRMDDQLKIRGYRIEPGEIESILQQHPLVKQAVVIAKEDAKANKRLVAYLVTEGMFDKAAMQHYLIGKLPEYMIPAVWVEMNSIPLTSNGKTDKKALPDPDITEQLSEEYVAPRNELEGKLVNIWQDLLGLTRIGINDNFFELGGDSILTIQVSSRIRRLGYELQPKEIFYQQTIGRLAQLLAKRSGTVMSGEQGVLTGPCGLLPVQQWYFESDPAAVSYFNQQVLLTIDKKINAPVLQEALAQLTRQHDALRFVYTKSEDGWKQEYGLKEPELVIEDLKDKAAEILSDEIATLTAKYQNNLDIEKGHLLRIVLLQTPAEEMDNRLFIAIHHLAVDGISWRILLEDLEQIIAGLASEKKFETSIKGTSYRQWYNTLAQYGESPLLLSQRNYWEQCVNNYQPLPVDETFAGATLKDEGNFYVKLAKEQTRQLLQEVPRVYHTEINDILLSALAATLAGWSGNEIITVGIEGHGREFITDKIDCSRTVGWFTSRYPVLLNTGNTANAGNLIKTIKEQLREVPGKGLGYGILKYINKEKSLEGNEPWDITFNYLGQLDNILKNSSLFRIAEEGTAFGLSGEQAKNSKLSVDSHILDGELVVKWSYNPMHYNADKIAGIAEAYKVWLESLIRHCTEQANIAEIHTPSDYGLNPEVGYTQLDNFLEEPWLGQKRKDKVQSIYRLSGLQQGMLFHDLYSKDSGAYISQFTCDLYQVELHHFRKSWDYVWAAHSILRSAFYHDAFSIPVQCVYREVDIEITELDFRDLSIADQSLEITAFLKKDSRRGFDFKQPPLTRFTLIRLNDDRHKMVWTAHHILFDGWSLPVLLGEFLNNYELLAAGTDVPQREEDRFEEYIRYIHNIDKAEQEKYWSHYLQGVEQSTLLPFIKNKAERTKGMGEYRSFALQPDAAAMAQLRAFAQKNRVTINTVMQGVWAYLLYQYTRNKDVVYAVTVSGRPDDFADIEHRVGMYINTLPLHSNMREDQTIVDWLHDLQSGQVASRQYQYTAINDIQAWTGIQGDFFDSLLVFLNYPVSNLLSAKQWLLQVENVFMHEQNNFPLTITISNTEDINIVFTYNTTLLKEEYIKEISGHFDFVLSQLVTKPNALLGDIDLLSPGEKQLLLNGFNNTTADYDLQKTIIDLFEEQVTHANNDIALVFEEQQLTYRELNEQSNQIAHYLISKGIQPGALVPVCIEQGPQMIVAILGILKAGAAYVPIDPEYPLDRIIYMIDDTSASFVLTSDVAKIKIDAPQTVEVIVIGVDNAASRHSIKNPGIKIEPKQLAYVIYTSGSTGTPKGVMIAHGSLLNYLLNDKTKYNTPEKENSGSFIHLSYTFDASLTAIFMPLLAGKRIVIGSKKHANVFEDRNLWKYAPYDFIKLTPAHLALLQDTIGDSDKKLTQCLVIGGEALLLSQFDQYVNKGMDATVINEYGPTEATVGCSVYSFDLSANHENINHSIPIGKPIDNTALYILGEKNQLLPVGVPGEICIGGAGLAQGYLNRPELTAEKFIPNPFSEEPGARLYRTGDQGCWLPDGNMEYLGRIDDQVKIRGYRIELGEIETVLLQSEIVKQAVVVAKEDSAGSNRLVGYVVVEDGMDEQAIQHFLLGKLPAYMVPTVWVQLDHLPLTSNGKVDRKSLPNPESSNQTSLEYLAPRNEQEQALTEIWQELLEIDSVGIHADFFDLGGHSLLAIRVISSIRMKLGVELSINDIFDYPTIALLAGKINSESRMELLPVIKASVRPSRIPLSFSQERLWFIDQLEGSLQYHITAVLRLRGNLDIPALEYSLAEVVNRHEILRTVYKEENGQSYQLILPEGRWKLKVTQGEIYKSDAAKLESYISIKAHQPFDLSKNDMLRVELITLSEDEHVLLVTMHHIASDGWSMPILVKEIAELYESKIQGRLPSLPVLPLQYADYSIWQRSYLQDELLDTKLSYWKSKLEGVSPLQLPSDFNRPAVISTRGASAEFSVPPELISALQALGKSKGATLFMTLLSAFKVLLYRYSSQEDICVGTSIAGRPQQELEGLIGFFVNTLALRSQVKGGVRFLDLLDEVRTTMLEAYAHQEVPFEKVVEAVIKERDASRSPLFQVMFVLRNTPEIPELRLVDLQLAGEPYEQTTVKFDLSFFLTESADGLQGSVLYSTDLYSRERIERMVAHFITLLTSIVANPDEKVGALSILSALEQNQLVLGFNVSHFKYQQKKTIVDHFIDQVIKNPEAIALAFEGRKLSYGDLDQQSNQLANYLLGNGVKEGSLVPLFIERSIEMIIGILGILKAGCAYVPIDTSFPKERVSFMLEDTVGTIVLSSSASREKLGDAGGMQIIELDMDKAVLAKEPSTNLRGSIALNQLAYVIYTSGSTGRPKGVMVDHENLADYVYGLDSATGINSFNSYALVSTIATDLGNTVLFSSLVSGGTLHIFSSEMISNIEGLHAYFNQHAIDCLKIVPSHWKALSLDGAPLLPKRLLVFGGESLQAEMLTTIRESSSTCKVLNHYGPTETTIGKLIHEVDINGHYATTIPIGKPFSNTRVYIVSADMSLCPVGVPGQLYIGGAGVARGYLHNEVLTKEKFIDDPFSQEEGKLYKTGDLVSYQDDGNIRFLGRVDDQVKIRGYRVEPGEISRVLEQSGLVSQAVVISRNDHQGNNQLVGYVVPEDEFDADGILSYLKENLPEYMVPAHLVELAQLPLTANGKVDRKALPEPEAGSNNTGEYIAPRTLAEEELVMIWQEVLEIDQVGIHDDFFELGGHSLLAVRLISAVRKAFKTELPISDVFDYPTVALLAAQLDNHGNLPVLQPSISVNSRLGNIPLSFSQERLWFIDQMEGSIQYHVPAVLQLKGKLDIDALGGALQQIVERHEVLRTVIHQQNGEAFQLIRKATGAVMNLVEGSGYNNNQPGLEKFIQQLIGSPFDLSKDLMLRAHLINLGKEEFILVLTIHHIASDGWSRSILVKELVELYSALSQQREPKLNMLPVQYADYAIWQRNYLQGGELDKKLLYWKTKLEGVAPLQLPTDFVRPAIQGTNGALVKFYIDSEFTGDIRELSRQYGATIYMTLLSAFKVLLYRYSGQEDICVGSGIAGRQQQELEGLIGFFVNTLAMRSQLHSGLRFTELLQAVKATTLEAYGHQEVPFEKVVEAVVKERDMSRNPIFQVTFVVQNTPDVPELRLGDVDLSVLNYEHVTTKFDITFSVTEIEDGLEGIVEYNTDLYNVQTIERMAGHFKELLQSVVKAPGEKIGDLQLLTSSEKHALLFDYNNNEFDYPKDKSLVELFEEQAKKSPDSIALIFQQEELSYAELDERSNQLAHYLVNCGVKNEILVPICIERSASMIIGILGILKAGGVYVPIDPEYPAERIRFILEDTEASLAVSSNASRSLLSDATGIKIVAIDGDWPVISQQSSAKLPVPVQPDYLAYVIYTSGSTGKPKGVMIEHGSVVNLIFAQSSYFGINPRDRILQFSNYSFDASIEQIFLALFNGSTLVLFPEGLQYNTDLFEEFLRKQAITHLHATPFFLENIQPNNYTSLKRVIAGGDKCRKELAARWQDKYNFYNEYGPTETTVTAIEYHYNNTNENYQIVPIGKPLPNVSAYVVDKNMALCPQGIPGELYMGGVQVARGYLNREDLTAERFIADIFSDKSGGRLYKTGDLTRWLPDGNLEFLGRIDDQVKIHGYRIELGEIEAGLNSIELVENSCVVAKQQDGVVSRLVGYYVPKPNIVQAKEHELYNGQVASWKEIHENEYVLAEDEKDVDTDPEFNILGWNDSFTRNPIGEAQMREWLKDFIAVVLKEKTENVLEIGCGSGLIFYPLAGKIKKYIGTDFSRHSINQVSERISKAERDYGAVELQVCAAHEISLKENERVDTIILNSVVQYFPGGDYLGDVIKKSIELLKGSGRIIIGDVRDNRLLYLFKARLHLLKLQGTVSIKEFEWAVEQEVLKEEELCFSPEYFYALQRLHPQITNVDIQWKQGNYINELTLYRYTVVIHVGINKPVFEPQWQTWKGSASTQDIYGQIEQKNKIVALKDVPNPRLWNERLLEQSIENNSVNTVNDLASILDKEDDQTASVNSLLQFAASNGYSSRLILDEDPLKVNVLLEQDPSDGFIKNIYGEKDGSGQGKYTNIPLFADISLQLQKDIKLLLLQQLPEYMVPAEWVALARLPLTINGKLDRVFLGQREDRIIANKLNYESPRNETEQKLAEIWQELLHLESAGIHDNFFELGGHSLMAMRVISAIRRELDLELAIKDLFIYPTIAELSEHLLSLSKGSLLPPIIREARPPRIPLSYSQERLWFIDRLGGSSQYHLPSIIRLKGRLDTAVLQQTFQAIIRRHEVLRTVILEEDGQGYQSKLNENLWQLAISDGSDYENDFEELQFFIQELISLPFDLSKDYMIRGHLIRLKENEHILVVAMHHIAADAWSTSIIISEVAALYQAIIANNEVQLPNLEIQYADYAIWQRKYLQGSILEHKLNYWVQKLEGVAPMNLPTDFARPPVLSNRGAISRFTIDKKLSAALKSLSQQQEATLYMTLLAAFNILLHRYSGQQDICVGTSVANRTRKEVEGLIGFFVNLLALRSDVRDELSFVELLQQVKITTLEAYSHQDTPFEKVVDAVVKERDMNKNPLVQVMLVLLNTPDVPDIQLGDLTLSVVELPHTKTLFDISIFIAETDHGLQGWLEYCTDLYTENTISQMIGNFQELLTNLVAAPKKKIGKIPMLTTTEELRLLVDFNNTQTTYPRDKSIVEIFEKQVTETPGAIALIFEEQKLTYKELNERSNQLAHYLRSIHVEQEMLVPICIERSVEMMVGILGILKAGAAYVPIDPQYPEERIRYMLEDISARIILSGKSSAANLPLRNDLTIIQLDEDWELISKQPVNNLQIPVVPGQLAYVIYTSGSTGKPKGVMVEHKNVVSLVKGVSYVSLTNKDILLSTGAPSFDATTFEYWSMLLNGGQLVLCGEHRLLDNVSLKEQINSGNVNIMWFTSSWFNQLVDIDITIFQNLQTLLVGGEKLSEQHIKKLRETYPSIHIINGYGPTENTTFSLSYPVGQTVNDTIPVGRPLNNRKAYIINQNGALVPIGVTGEICLAGDGLARGYLNNEELTSQKFVPNPFGAASDRMYRTGDQGCWLQDGNIQFQGRADDQVKIRGYRIELGEIETLLGQGVGVKQCVVLAKEDNSGRKRLVAYIVPDDGFNKESVIAYLVERLPDYMVPVFWVTLEQMPLTTNGKIDRNALPDPDVNETVTGYMAPRTAMEEQLVGIWQQLLDIEQVGIQDNFFELGGDSILAIQAVSRTRNAGYEVTVADFFTYQTIAQLATIIERGNDQTGEVKGEQGVLSGMSGLLPVQQWYFENTQSAFSHFNQSVLLKINKAVTETALKKAIEQLTTQHDALRFKYYQKEGQWQQEYGSVKAAISTADLRLEPAVSQASLITSLADSFQRSLDIGKGEIMRVVWIQTNPSETENRVLIIIHHLAVDGVSWRILLEQLDRLLTGLTSNHTIELGNKSTSYRQWYEYLVQFGQTEGLLSQKAYWTETVKSYQPLIADNNYTGNTADKEMAGLTVKLEPTQTRRLLQEVPRVYHTEINDLLLCALALTIGNWNKTGKVVVCLEGHGREHIADAADINYTVGWFTSLYPLLLNISAANGPGDSIKSVKEQLRLVPARGIGYGVLRYINKEKSLQGNHPWDIQFNYLGQLDNVVKDSKWLSVAEESTGAGRSEEQAVNEKLSVTSFVRKGELVLNWVYNTRYFDEETIKTLTGKYLEQLNVLIEHCMEQAKLGVVYTPSDYGLGADISYTELDAFLEDDTDNIMSF